MSELRDFLNWFDGFAENIDKTPNTKQWTKIKERVLALKDAKGVDAVEVSTSPAAAAGKVQAPVSAPPPPPRAKSKPDMSKFKFVIDEQGRVLRGTGQPVLPEEVTEDIYDYRDGDDPDLGAIVWADGRTGARMVDVMILAVQPQ